jgi:multiple sugar transport system ATP-binding protein
MVFQNYALYPHMTVYENMAFGLTLRKLPKAEIDRRVREAAELLQIGHLLDRKPKALSGGQRQRVAVGRAIVRKPKVFLFDEPLSNLDAKMRVSTRAEISKLHARLDATMIYVTHDQVEAMTMGDRICVMKDGVIQQVAAPLELYNRPANLFVAGFIGSPPMNFFRGRIVAEAGQPVFIGETSGVRVALSAAQAGPAAGRAVVLGIRPEDMTEASDESSAVEALVETVEPMGAETFLHLTAGTTDFTARVRPDSPAGRGQRIRLRFVSEKIRLFDAETEHAR